MAWNFSSCAPDTFGIKSMSRQKRIAVLFTETFIDYFIMTNKFAAAKQPIRCLIRLQDHVMLNRIDVTSQFKAQRNLFADCFIKNECYKKVTAGIQNSNVNFIPQLEERQSGYISSQMNQADIPLAS